LFGVLVDGLVVEVVGEPAELVEEEAARYFGFHVMRLLRAEGFCRR